MYEQYQLKNKANVLLIPVEGTQAATVLVMYPLGSRYEPQKLNGVSHYIEHMMFKGTRKRKTAKVLTREIDRLGAGYNAFTSKEYTGYYIKTDGAYTETACDILSDMLFNSVFDAKEMEKEKGPIIEELRMYQDNPIMNLDTIFESLMYDGCPLGWDIGGTVKHVRSYKRPDVLAFKKKFYGPNNMTVVVAGNITNETRALVQKYFGAGKNGGQPSKAYKAHTFGSAAKTKRLKVEKKQTDQAQVMVGWPGYRLGAKENVVLSVITTILGGSMSSRLFDEIREKRGLAYTVRSDYEAYRDTGYAYVRAGLEAKNINKTIALIQKEVAKLASKGVTARELKDAKTHIHGSKTLSLEDSSAVANWFAHEALFAKKMTTPQQWLAKIEKVTAADVQRVAKHIFKPNQLRVAIIGDVEASSITY